MVGRLYAVCIADLALMVIVAAVIVFMLIRR